MKKVIIGIITIVILAAFIPFQKKLKVDRSTSVADLQEALGTEYKSKKPNTKIRGVKASIGKDIVNHGFSKQKGEKKSRRQSKHFVCTSCHNVKKEDPNLFHVTPEARLNYTIEKGIPFLQATTLYGAVNRDTYYNEDYEKKYGDLVRPARNDIRGAIQLCALECAQGRKLKKWELESILAYLWTIDLKVGDLEISDGEIEILKNAVDDPSLHKVGLQLLASKYAKKSGATFLDPPSDRKVGVGLKGNPDNGARIYEQSCLHCHYQKRYSFLHLDKKPLSINHLNSKADTYNRHSIYQVVRYGTYSKYGKRSYMPHYTKERMSDQQLADLRAYLAEGTKDM